MTTTTHPTVHAEVRGRTATITGTDGRHEKLDPVAGADVRAAIVTYAARIAHEHGQPVELVTSGDHGTHRLEVDPDGQVRALDDDAPPAVIEPPLRPVSDPPATRRASFIRSGTDPALIASTGLRGWLRARGLPLPPTPADIARHGQLRTISAHWAGPRTIAVVNGKGGVGKTPTTAMLAAVYARYGGGAVLAFDNNDTRGTLGWRTEQAGHDATIADLLDQVSELDDAPVSELAGYVHHQTEDRYDVLRSNPRVLSAAQRLDTAEFDRLVHTVTRGYRIVVFDSGNDESADRWLRMVDWAGQLVVPTLASPESAESAALLLEALGARDERSAALARDAVVVITHAEPSSAARTRELVDTFGRLARAVAVIPFDPALKSGPLRFGTLRPDTRQAWIRAAAHVAERF